MKKIKILSTKTLSNDLKHLFSDLKFDLYHNDFISIQPLILNLPKHDGSWIFTSKNAVEAVFSSNQNIDNFFNKIYCVGKNTKSLLVKKGQKIAKMAQNSSNLAEFISKTAKNEKFIFCRSNIKNEEFSERSVTAPQDYYGKSKLEAEKYLTLNYVKSKISVVIIRSPIVYGFPLKANFRLLVKLVSLRFPLPFLCLKNLRDFIYVRNLTDALILCSEHPRASGKVYLVSDGQPISTPVLIKKISNLIQIRAFLFPFPIFLVKFLAYIFFHSNKCNKLINSLRINSSTIKRDLKWNPPYTLDQGLKETLDRFNYL